MNYKHITVMIPQKLKKVNDVGDDVFIICKPQQRVVWLVLKLRIYFPTEIK
jgi:hypothetical protein